MGRLGEWHGGPRTGHARQFSSCGLFPSRRQHPAHPRGSPSYEEVWSRPHPRNCCRVRNTNRSRQGHLPSSAQNRPHRAPVSGASRGNRRAAWSASENDLSGGAAGGPCELHDSPVTQGRDQQLEGIWPRKPNPTHCAGVGQALARMHLAGRDFAMVRANALAVSGWRPLFDAAASRADELQHGLRAFIEAELDHLESNVWPRNLPAGVIHADLFPDNVFFLGERVSGIIDFTFACNDMLAYDVAICLNAWCFETDYSFNVTKARAFLNAYGRERQLSNAEQNALPLLARGAALRFLLTRLVDFLNVPPGALVRPKDPIEYVRKLRFQQGVASMRDYGVATSGLVA